MGEYKYRRKNRIKIYTKEERKIRNEMIQHAKRDVTAAEYITNVLGLTLAATRKGQRYLKCKELSSLVVDMKTNNIYWNKIGSRPLDIFSFISVYENCSMSEAIDLGLKYYAERDPNIAEIYHYDEKKDKTYISQGLSLPEPFENDYRATQYLVIKRGINKDVIQYLKDKGMFYEDTYHNCVFIGYDEKGKAQFANKRGTHPEIKYQRDCLGSFKKNGFFIENENSKIKKLVLTECVIDALSYLSLEESDKDVHILASSGAGSVANTLWYNRGIRKSLRNIDEIICAFDNDPAGEHAKKQVEEYIKQNHLNIKISEFQYKGQKLDEREDLNEFLRRIQANDNDENIECTISNEENFKEEEEQVR